MKQSTQVASPCIGVCSIDDDTGYCKGCLRTLDEVASWMCMSEDARRSVVGELDARREATQAA